MGRERCCKEAILLPYKISVSSSYPELFSLETIVVSVGKNKAATEGLDIVSIYIYLYIYIYIYPLPFLLSLSLHSHSTPPGHHRVPG